VTIAHEHDSYLCLSSEEHARLVNAIPQIGPRLRDARRREESEPARRAVMEFLFAWNPYEYYGARQEADVWMAAEAILYALSSREVQSKVELAAYISDMYDRWYGGVDFFGEKHVFTPEICAEPARSIWAWWRARQRYA
jgi:hypothetical protein